MEDLISEILDVTGYALTSQVGDATGLAASLNIIQARAEREWRRLSGGAEPAQDPASAGTG